MGSLAIYIGLGHLILQFGGSTSNNPFLAQEIPTVTYTITKTHTTPETYTIYHTTTVYPYTKTSKTKLPSVPYTIITTHTSPEIYTIHHTTQVFPYTKTSTTKLPTVYNTVIKTNTHPEMSTIYDTTTVSPYTETPTTRCPDAYEEFVGVEGCFKWSLYPPRNWFEARDYCESINSHMAYPDPVSVSDAVTLRRNLLHINGHATFWLGARAGSLADANKYVWEHDGTVLSSNNLLWFPGLPMDHYNEYCLTLLADQISNNKHPGQPYGKDLCSSTFHTTLCKANNEQHDGGNSLGYERNATELANNEQHGCSCEIVMGKGCILGAPNKRTKACQCKTTGPVSYKNTTCVGYIVSCDDPDSYYCKHSGISYEFCEQAVYNGGNCLGYERNATELGCPDGYEEFVGVEGCFKWSSNPPRTWFQAKAYCGSINSHMAYPDPARSDAATLRRRILYTHGHATFWLGARANGSQYVWEYDNKVLSSNNSLWFPGLAMDHYNKYCLTLLADEISMDNHPGKPYGKDPCLSALHSTLCKVPSVVHDPCQSNPCVLNAECSARGTNIACTCPIGYEGDSFKSCTKKNPCKSNPCGIDANCHSPGENLICTCPDGYEGNPLFNCKRRYPCQPNPCGVNADCHVRGESQICSCPAGYGGDPLSACVLARG